MTEEDNVNSPGPEAKDNDEPAATGEGSQGEGSPRKLEVHWAPAPPDKAEDQDKKSEPSDTDKASPDEDEALGMDGGVEEASGKAAKEGGASPFPLLEKTPPKAKSELPGAVASKVKAWIQASRPAYFIVTLFPLLLGYIVANRYLEASRPGLFILILLASVLVHAAANMCNDYFEDKGGVDSADSLGGSRVLQEGKITLEQLKRGIIACYLVAFVLAIFIVGRNSALWLMVLFAAFSSFFYVAPPVKYGHRALGELMVFLNMGVIMVVGTFITLTGGADKSIIAISLPPAFMVAGILYYQSLPEILKDREVGKVTLAGLLGKEGAALVYLLWWPFVWFLIFNLYLSGHVGGVSMLCLVALPLHVVVTLRVYQAGDWVELDKSGWLVKIIYSITALAMLLGASCTGA